VCLDVNHGDINCKRCSHRLVMLHTQTY